MITFKEIVIVVASATAIIVVGYVSLVGLIIATSM
jgi:ABC-type Fe3+-siderophore transport system permease subunit